MEKAMVDALTRRILSSAIEVHRVLGPGLLESTYRSCLVAQLSINGMSSRHEVPIPLTYKGSTISNAYRADIIVEDAVLLELKAVQELQAFHTAQILTYLRHSELPAALLINFSEPTLMKGVRRYSRRFKAPAQPAPLADRT